MTKRWTLLNGLENIYYFSCHHICQWSKTCACFTCMTKVSQTSPNYEIISNEISYFLAFKENKYNLLEGCDKGRRLHLCILGWSMRCTHLAPYSDPLSSDRLYSTVILLLMFSEIIVFIPRNFWTLSCHNKHTICEFGILLNVSRFNMQTTLFLQMGLWPDLQGLTCF